MLTVALDTGPLYGAVTGVGRTVIEMMSEFERRSDDLAVIPYVLSFRAPLRADTRRLHFPAGLALRGWSRTDFPRVDGTLAGAQLIHGTNYVVPPSRLPRLVTVNDCWALRHPERCSPAVNLSMSVLRRSIIRGAHVHAPSQATADGVRDLFPTAPVTVVPWAAPRIHDAPPVRPNGADWPADTSFVLSVGTIDKRKNLVRLIGAFATLAADHPDLRLVVAGARGNAAPEVDAAIGELPASAKIRVHVLSGLDPAEISWLYRNAAVVTYPSLDEGFGFPVLEAMAAGTPVVAAASGSLPEIAGGAALMFDPADSDALAAAVDVVLNDDDRRRQMVAAGRQRVLEFSWSATADGLMSLYRMLVESSNAQRKARLRTRE